jgi:hypothetical protein
VSLGPPGEQLVVSGHVGYGPGAGGKRARVVVRCRDRYTAGLLTLNRTAIRRHRQRPPRAIQALRDIDPWTVE